MVFRVSGRPSQAKYLTHYHCDYIELLALESKEAIFTSDIIASIRNSGEEDSLELPGGMSVAEACDENESNIRSLFPELVARSNAYGANYPFIVTDEKIEFSTGNVDETKPQLYLFLLLCSCQYYIEPSYRDTLRTDFEELCKHALGAYLPSQAQCKRFGKSATDGADYIGSLIVKIQRLASDLGQKVASSFQSGISPQNTGDGGLDVVGWIPVEADSCNDQLPIFFGQCATGDDWLAKQWEPRKMVRRFENIDPILTLLIPYDCRLLNRSLAQQAEIDVPLFFDRFRILNSIQDEFDAETYLKSLASLIPAAINYEPDIV